MHVLLMRGSIALASALILLSVTVSFAQTKENAALSATIRKMILTDPRSSEMTASEIDAMVAALTAQAEVQGLTSEDIAWRPRDPASFSDATENPVEACSYSEFLCRLNDAFGFTESPAVTPWILAVCSALLLFLIGSILLHTHGHHPFAGNLRREG